MYFGKSPLYVSLQRRYPVVCALSMNLWTTNLEVSLWSGDVVRQPGPVQKSKYATTGICLEPGLRFAFHPVPLKLNPRCPNVIILSAR